MTPLADAVAWLAGSFADRLASQRTWAERFALVEELLLAGRSSGPAPDPMVAWMWRELETTRGTASIADLVARTGRSHRHVTTRFREQVGLTPKAAANLLRFENAVRAVHRGMPLADLATATGYADQSHLTHEFVKHAGHTPGGWRTSVDFLQDAPA